MKEITPKLRKEMEALIYKYFDTVDVTKTNSEKYKTMFAKMDNKEFGKFISMDFPYRFYYSPFKIEPSMSDITDSLKVLNVPLFEKVNLPYFYKNKDGVPVQTKECLVCYIHAKKLQQFITKKNAMSIEISQRNMKNGLLISNDKNAKESDREMETFILADLGNTMKEFSRHKADSMNAKSVMYNEINTKGTFSLKDAPVDKDDSISKNLLNTYLIGAHLQSNLINEDYYLPYTMKNKQKSVVRV